MIDVPEVKDSRQIIVNFRVVFSGRTLYSHSVYPHTLSVDATTRSPYNSFQVECAAITSHLILQINLVTLKPSKSSETSNVY